MVERIRVGGCYWLSAAPNTIGHQFHTSRFRRSREHSGLDSVAVHGIRIMDCRKGPASAPARGETWTELMVGVKLCDR